MAHSMAIEWFKRKKQMEELVDKYTVLRNDPSASPAEVKAAENDIEVLRAFILDAQMRRLNGEPDLE
jgi:hypothetical protein